MSKKSAKIAALLEGCDGQGYPSQYVGYFRCFNAELFFEAHDVLEELWLRDKASLNYAFYKGLIQFAGAFVHLRKDRLSPAVALFNLAEDNLAKYGPLHDGLDLKSLLETLNSWRSRIVASNYSSNPLSQTPSPKLSLAARQ